MNFKQDLNLVGSSREIEKLRVSNVKKIAVLRANAVGDFIFCLPALESLRQAYPQAEIVYLGRPWHRHFLKDRPGPIDRVEVVPYSKGIYDPPVGKKVETKALDHFFSRMRKEHFDIALQMHGGGENSNRFLLQLGARITAGARATNALPLSRSIPYFLFQKEVLRYLEIVGLVGAPVHSVEPNLAVTSQDIEESLAVIPETTAPLVLIHPGAQDPRRRWPVGKFAMLADFLVEEFGAEIVINAVPSEQVISDQIRELMRYRSIDIVGRLDMNGLHGLIARSQLIISNDSGPFHLAVAQKRPAVGIFWGPNAITCSPSYLAHCAFHISWQMSCPKCGREFFRNGSEYNRCEHEDSIVEEISVDEVLGSARNFLSIAKTSLSVTSP